MPGPTGTVTVAAAQFRSVPEKPDANLVRAENCVRKAKNEGAEIVAFPEQFATGWNPLSDEHLQEISGPVISRLQEYARRYEIAVLGSLRERCQGGPRNTCVMIDRTGRIGAVYAKCHLFTPAGEERIYLPGNEIALFSLSSLQCGIAICYDLRFGALFRLYERAGAGAVFVPAAWPVERIKHWILLARARALENGMYVIGINTTGLNSTGHYSGHSIVVDPEGNVVKEAGESEEVLVADLDPEMVIRVRQKSNVRQDERTGLYHSLSRSIRGKEETRTGTIGRI